MNCNKSLDEINNNSTNKKISVASNGTLDATYFVSSDNQISGEISYEINEDDTISIVGSNNFSTTNFSFLPSIDLGDGVKHKLYEIGKLDDIIGIFQSSNNVSRYVSIPENVPNIVGHTFESCANMCSINL